jgi:2-polyprenyl-3-methyl-5-hydroxy-6-metoxy-1,4-benzoquinol methylase
MDAFAMLRCEACGGRWVVCSGEDLPNYEAEYAGAERGIYRRYAQEAERVRAGRRPPLYWFQRRQLQRIRPFDQGRLMELGCGNGMFLLAASRAGWQAEGADISPAAATFARRTSGCRVHVGAPADVLRVPRSYEVICAFEVLEHVLDPLSDLVTITSALVPGGTLAMSVPNDRSPFVRNPPDPEGRPPYHINFFGPMTLRTTLAEAGLEIIWLYEKPFPWSETGRSRWVRLVLLPWLAASGYVLGRKGSRLVAWARRPSDPD